MLRKPYISSKCDVFFFAFGISYALKVENSFESMNIFKQNCSCVDVLFSLNWILNIVHLSSSFVKQILSLHSATYYSTKKTCWK